VRLRAALGGIFGSVAVLIVGWQAGAAAAHNTETSAAPPTSSSTTSSTPSSTATPVPSSTPAPSATSTAGASKSGSYTGTVSETQFGPVQVKIVVANGKITDVIALQLTNRGGRSQQISNYAAPLLRQEVLKAQSANVNSVSGATYTSDGYIKSLQSALDQAGL
jgi:uncharacterized protein with FMN-binding domain